ncbi:SDR family oxidoreductase [Corynebacterium hindlerae]|uniref:SDR family oxidoreductase n=1 Tax=Corynebacterium hindlerae TaxID=699041 RepID=UPI001AD6B6EE|nr:SDR family oxidoreductase [Corynebacterium hindlerae]QTH59967.1 SDR family oxidoreductase [Corynebacterium hindlerae]
MKTAVVTGASGGVGLEVTRMLLNDGWSVHAQYRTAPGPLDAHWWQASFPDICGAPSLTSLDALIHCAGVCSLGPVAEPDVAEWSDAFAVNVLAPVELTAHYLPLLRAGRGNVVYLNSGAGLRANPGWGSYAASKFAARAWCDALRQEEPDIRVTSVHPGRIDTPMQEAVVAAEGGVYSPSAYLSASTVAEAVLHALNTPEDGHQHEVILRPRG